MARPTIDAADKKVQHKFYSTASSWEEFGVIAATYGLTASQLFEIFINKMVDKKNNSTVVEALGLEKAKRKEKARLIENRNARATGKPVHREVEGQTELQFGEVETGEENKDSTDKK